MRLVWLDLLLTILVLVDRELDCFLSTSCSLTMQSSSSHIRPQIHMNLLPHIYTHTDTHTCTYSYLTLPTYTMPLVNGRLFVRTCIVLYALFDSGQNLSFLTLYKWAIIQDCTLLNSAAKLCLSRLRRRNGCFQYLQSPWKFKIR